MSITYGLKVNFHVCIVTMINHTAVKQAANASGHADGGHAAASECAEPGHNSTQGAGSHVEDVSAARAARRGLRGDESGDGWSCNVYFKCYQLM